MSQLSASLNDFDWEFLGDDRDVLARPARASPAAGPAVMAGDDDRGWPASTGTTGSTTGAATGRAGARAGGAGGGGGELGLEGTCIDPDIEAAVQDILAGGDGSASAKHLLSPVPSSSAELGSGRRRVMKSPQDVDKQQQRWAEQEAVNAKKMAAKYGADDSDSKAREAVVGKRVHNLTTFNKEKLGGETWINQKTVDKHFTHRDPLVRCAPV